MHQLAPLMAGIRGARNGTVTVLERDSFEAAPVYADASGASRRYGPHQLDALGCVSAYVDRLVDVIVRDASGAVVREWTDGVSSGATVVEHTVFGERTTLAEALDLLLVSAGTTDFNVLVDAEEMSVFAAINGSSGVFYSAASYGASGDGTGDDWGPIQAAIDAAQAAGGGIVFLPAGTYAISTALGLPDGVSLLGAGASSTRIVTSSSTEALLQVFGVEKRQTIQAIAFASSAPTALSLVYLDGGDVTIDACLFDGDMNTGRLLETNLDVSCRVSRCEFLIVAQTTSAIDTYQPGFGSVRVDVSQCTFVAPAEHTSSSGMVGIANVHLDGCQFDVSAATTGSITCVVFAGTIYGTMDGCEVSATSGATVTVLNGGNLNSTSEFIFEDCTLCDNSDAFTLYAAVNDGTGYYCRLKTVEARHSPVTDDAAAVNTDTTHYIFPDATQYGVVSVISEDATAGALASGMVFGAATGAAYDRVPMGRVCDVVFVSIAAETYSLNDNLSRNSVAPTWKFIANTVFAFRMLTARAYAQSPSAGMLARWHCLTMGCGESTVDTTMLEAYSI